MTGSEYSSERIDVDTVECPTCQGTGRCVQCQGEGRIPFKMAGEIEKRFKERENEIRNEGRNEAQKTVEARDQTIKSLREEIKQSNDALSKAKEAGRVAGIREASKGTESQNERIHSLQTDKDTLERKIVRLQNDLSAVNQNRERVEIQAKEHGREEGRRERDKEVNAKAKKISSLEDEKDLLENRVAEFEAKDRKRDGENRKLRESVRRLEEAIKIRETEKTPQEYGLLKEKTLTSFLIHEFPDDSILPTSASREGDIVQSVHYEGAMVGAILFERKETDRFGKEWIPKLEKDRLRREADYAVLVSKTMNKEDDPVRFKADNILVAKPDKDILKNFVSHLRQLIIVAKSNIDDSKKQEMKANLERVVESYRRIWTNNIAIARLISKPLEEIAKASKEGMAGITEMTKMLKLPSPEPLPELPYKPELLP